MSTGSIARSAPCIASSHPPVYRLAERDRIACAGQKNDWDEVSYGLKH
jgi:hypothetical protein